MKIGEKLKNSKVKYLLVILLVVALVLGSLALANAETLLHDEPRGTIITFSGKQWIILEQMPNGETYILLNDQIGTRAFDPDNTNLFNPSDTNNIAYYLNNNFYNSLSQKELIADHSWDRISVNGSRLDSTDYGNVTCKIGLLSYREYERYSKYYNSNGILPSSYSYWWWTRTPRTEYSSNVWYVRANGGLDGSNAYNTSGSVRPALYLKSGILIDQNKVVVGEGSINRPAQPSGVSANAESSTSVNISWQANTEADLAGYKIYRNNTEIANVDKTVTTYNDATVAPGITYTYEITAYNTSNLESERSSPVTVTTPPATPTGVTGQVAGKNITLTWQVPGNPQYIIERSTDGISFTQVAEVTQTSYTETVPLWGTTYYYRVAQKAQDGTVSEFSDPIQVTIDPVPVPTNLSATLDGKNVILNWQSAEGITSYVVERSTDNATWSILANVSNATSYTDQATDPNTNYFYRVRSDGGNGQISEPSNTVKITTPPAAPGNVRATVTGKTVVLSWDASVGATAYIIERSTDGTSFANVAEGTGTTYTDTAPNWNKTYYYRVLAKNSDGIASEPSEIVSAVIPAVPVPTGLTANVSGNSVSLSWTSINGISKYRIERSQNNITWNNLAEVNSTSYQDQDLDWDTKYYYRVRAVDGDQMSEPSEVVSVQTPVPPAPVAPRIAYRIDGTNIELSWIYQRNCDGYKIYVNDILEAELPSDKTNYSFAGERGKSYTIKVEAYNAYGEASSSVTVKISEMPMPGVGTMAGDVLKYAGITFASTGGLLALGLALKGSGWLIAIIRMFSGI